MGEPIIFEGIRMGMSRWGVALMLGFLVGEIIPTAAWAQAGFYVTPSFSFGEVYDDNIFSASSGREQDLISRFSPGIQVGYQSTPLTLSGGYTFDSEVFVVHPELTTAQARQRASLDVRYLPISSLTLSLTNTYIETQTSGDINVQTGIQEGRVRTEQLAFLPSIAYRFDPLTTATGGYGFTKTEQAGGTTNDAHIVNWALDRRITSLDTGSLGYIFRSFRFDGDSFTDGDSFAGGETTTSHAFTFGWTRQITPLTEISLRAGPRFSEGSVNAEALASLRHRLEHGELSFTYSSSQDSVAGEAGAVNTHSFSASLTYRFLQFLEVGAAPAFYRNTRGNAEAKVYQLNLNATYQINQWLSLKSSYLFSFQQGLLDSTPAIAQPGNGNILHNIALLSLVITYPYRVY
jgi:hypothetical protein